MSALPGKYNFRIQRGADFARVFVKQAADVAVDLTGLKVRAQFREDGAEVGVTTTTTLVLELEDSAGIEITDPAEGEITLVLTNAQTAAMCPKNIITYLVYGIELYDDSVSPELVTPFLQGRVTINPEVVR